MSTVSNMNVSTESIAALGRVWQTGLLAASAASAANLVIYFITSALGVSFDFMPEGMPAPPFFMAVIFATFVGVLAGTLLFSLMPRFSRRPVSTFRTVAIIALVLSFAQPLMLLTGILPGPSVGINTVLVLEIMHVVAGVIAIWLLTTRARAS